MKRVELANLAATVAQCRTKGLATESLLKWSSFYLNLKKIQEELAEKAKQLQIQLGVTVNAMGEIDSTTSGRDAVKKYRDAEGLLMDEDIKLKAEKFLTPEELVTIKDQNDLTTHAYITLHDILVIETKTKKE